MPVIEVDGITPTALSADARNGKLTSGSYTVNTTATIAIPSWARGFRLYPSSNDIRFAVGEAPAAIGAGTLTVGHTAKADSWETRLLESGATNVQLLSTASTTVIVGFF